MFSNKRNIVLESKFQPGWSYKIAFKKKGENAGASDWFRIVPRGHRYRVVVTVLRQQKFVDMIPKGFKDLLLPTPLAFSHSFLFTLIIIFTGSVRAQANLVPGTFFDFRYVTLFSSIE